MNRFSLPLDKCVLLPWVHIFFDSTKVFISLAVIVGYLGSAICLQRSFACFPLKSSIQPLRKTSTTQRSKGPFSALLISLQVSWQAMSSLSADNIALSLLLALLLLNDASAEALNDTTEPETQDQMPSSVAEAQEQALKPRRPVETPPTEYLPYPPPDNYQWPPGENAGNENPQYVPRKVPSPCGYCEWGQVMP